MPAEHLLDIGQLNDAQQESLRLMLQHARGAHWVNIEVRRDGRDEYFQADWLKQAQSRTLTLLAGS